MQTLEIKENTTGKGVVVRAQPDTPGSVRPLVSTQSNRTQTLKMKKKTKEKGVVSNKTQTLEMKENTKEKGVVSNKTQTLEMKENTKAKGVVMHAQPDTLGSIRPLVSAQSNRTQILEMKENTKGREVVWAGGSSMLVTRRNLLPSLRTICLFGVCFLIACLLLSV
ncbi:hypothetical protein H4582DRAFT_1921384 [Lactarius indigo]|nr:hypothetical protein H4582DRAFT_1921384 [Lactarius indigo]